MSDGRLLFLLFMAGVYVINRRMKKNTNQNEKQERRMPSAGTSPSPAMPSAQGEPLASAVPIYDEKMVFQPNAELSEEKPLADDRHSYRKETELRETDWPVRPLVSSHQRDEARQWNNPLPKVSDHPLVQAVVMQEILGRPRSKRSSVANREAQRQR